MAQLRKKDKGGRRWLALPKASPQQWLPQQRLPSRTRGWGWGGAILHSPAQANFSWRFRLSTVPAECFPPGAIPSVEEADVNKRLRDSSLLPPSEAYSSGSKSSPVRPGDWDRGTTHETPFCIMVTAGMTGALLYWPLRPTEFAS